MPVIAKEDATPFVPDDRTLPALREAVQHCHGCDLYRNATQAVLERWKQEPNQRGLKSQL